MIAFQLLMSQCLGYCCFQGHLVRKKCIQVPGPENRMDLVELRLLEQDPIAKFLCCKAK